MKKLPEKPCVCAASIRGFSIHYHCLVAAMGAYDPSPGYFCKQRGEPRGYRELVRFLDQEIGVEE